MFRPILPTDLVALGLRSGLMLWEAQAVIAMRMLGLAGMWRVGPAENLRMVTEKVAAVQAGAGAAARAAMAGGNPAEVASAALKPVRRRTAANARRLARRGPGWPG